MLPSYVTGEMQTWWVWSITGVEVASSQAGKEWSRRVDLGRQQTSPHLSSPFNCALRDSNSCHTTDGAIVSMAADEMAESSKFLLVRSFDVPPLPQ